MYEKPGLVSIIIPAYNAANFIGETIQSILQQSYTNWELIIVNDGSKDNTVEICNLFLDERILLINQSNSGVAVARNNGMKLANGEYIIFFDADDLMTTDFLKVRIDALSINDRAGFAGGIVETFPLNAATKNAVAKDPETEILFFDSSASTVPSNYMFRKSILTTNNIVFNTDLSSTADRFFILEVSKYAKGLCLQTEKGKLLYRYTNQSMSNLVSPKLIIDNEKFYYELKRKNLLPKKNLSRFRSLYFLSLAKGFGMVHSWKLVAKYIIKSFINHPFLFLQDMGKTIKRYSTKPIEA
ncbi:MAG: glycosyltransferase family 2 protein [Bacteroidetes bacterium]|nr:glycosyltransferase family 2 protein [Bacteroidota bacterium]